MTNNKFQDDKLNLIPEIFAVIEGKLNKNRRLRYTKVDVKSNGLGGQYMIGFDIAEVVEE